MPSPAAGIEVSGIMQIALTVRDVAVSLPFYRDAVGLRFLFSAGPNLAFLDAGGVRLMLTSPEGGLQPGTGSVLYFRVADIRGAYEAMMGRGVRFEDEPHRIAQMPDHDLWICAFRDPDGLLLALMCELPKAGD
jgi:methylmalonyl-CoA/ethylmalonyl-CoA epimerase